MCLSVKQPTKTFPVINLMIQKAMFCYIWQNGFVPGPPCHMGSPKDKREKAKTNILFCIFENNVCVTLTTAIFNLLKSAWPFMIFHN